jgi:hypothetical protein
MTTHVADEKSESASGGKLGEPVSQAGTVQLQLQEVPLYTSDLYCPEVDISAIDPHKLKRKIDVQLLPWLTLLYLMNFLDRGSIGNARVCTLCICTLLAFPHGFFIPHSCIRCKRVSTSQITNFFWCSQYFSFPMLSLRWGTSESSPSYKYTH